MSSDTKKIRVQPDAFVSPRYDEIALVLQGGGAIGSYQAGVIEGLAEANVEPDWIAGVSIGALNTAIVAGNPPEKRVEALRCFWSAICHPLDWVGSVSAWALPGMGLHDLSRKWAGMWATGRALTEGQPGFVRCAFHCRWLASPTSIPTGSATTTQSRSRRRCSNSTISTASTMAAYACR